MDYQYILYEERGPVAIITFNRPDKRNAWNVPILRETIAAIQRANASEAVRAIVITGSGASYCAGMDFKAPPEPPDASGRPPTTASLTMGREEHDWLRLLAESKPNIVAVNGPAVGIGVTHILAADVRIAARSATFGFPFLRLGVMPEVGCSALLPRLVGFGRALDICLRSATLDAEEALRIGLVTAVHPDAELLDAALALAGQFAAYPPLQVRLTRRMFYENAGKGRSEEIFATENAAFVEMFKANRKPRPT
ncbi:MAG: enoyl-CoA hydratase/isomerase family protein [Gammaproteobacteria bacterium]